MRSLLLMLMLPRLSCAFARSKFLMSSIKCESVAKAMRLEAEQASTEGTQGVKAPATHLHKPAQRMHLHSDTHTHTLLSLACATAGTSFFDNPAIQGFCKL